MGDDLVFQHSQHPRFSSQVTSSVIGIRSLSRFSYNLSPRCIPSTISLTIFPFLSSLQMCILSQSLRALILLTNIFILAHCLREAGNPLPKGKDGKSFLLRIHCLKLVFYSMGWLSSMLVCSSVEQVFNEFADIAALLSYSSSSHSFLNPLSSYSFRRILYAGAV